MKNEFTCVLVNLTTPTQEIASQVATLLRDSIDHFSFKMDADDIIMPSTLEDGPDRTYTNVSMIISVDTDTLSDTMDNLPSFFRMMLDPINEGKYPKIYEDWSVSVLMEQKADGLQIHEAVYHLYRDSQNVGKTVESLEYVNSLLHKKIITLEHRMEAMEESYRGMVAFLHDGINIKRMKEVLVETAKAVDPDLLQGVNIVRYH